MARRVRAYTEIGRRISDLGKRQRLLARVLGVSQQTVSKKLRGETAILLSDLENLGSHYEVPLTYFFEQEPPPAELAVALERVKKGPAVLKDLVVLLSRLHDPALGRVLELAKFIVQGSQKSKRRGSKTSRPSVSSSEKGAAEDAGPYGE